MTFPEAVKSLTPSVGDWRAARAAIELSMVAAGGLSGALHGLRRGYDMIGVAVIAIVTGLGGGIPELRPRCGQKPEQRRQPHFSGVLSPSFFRNSENSPSGAFCSLSSSAFSRRASSMRPAFLYAIIRL